MTNKPDFDSSTQQFSVVVPAAGIGKRMQTDCPKQYLKIGTKCIIEHTISRLLSHPKIKNVIVALAEHDNVFAKLAIANNPNVKSVVGGKERSDSVLAGLRAINNENWVLVHDAARPCITHADINQLITFCIDNDKGAILATPVRDTMKRTSTSGQIQHTENRDNLWHAQTPQMFNHAQLQSSLEQALANNIAITDEASAIENSGAPSYVVEGREDNIKITRPSDLNLAAFILEQQKEISCV
ncbi:2-C-methyl-D-erythritol 4-phosphate cytidylyltransferase [Thalassomonas sp. M1454]|uniref:2-C-methyl-D-erythritol 4-phosphate cytidylyltransferase n=1 Tax=Thalassomonas sp. M1454 TaxID=2594477 RepID=UPI00117FC4E8|nr:2-C-methyl-D-erythritol 4-phosphate cytidylyltransferase [Thalassomonas sp. M1454]TRX55820.1 2-C-methyl-D-erythritol 4-phosphate cytidylyltransferase [Thalassomonas sp. M1454]